MGTNIASGAETSVRSLTVRGLVLVGILAVMLGLAVTALFGTMSGLDEEADALERVGGQRMMAQRVALLAERLGSAGEPDWQKQRYRQEMRQLLERMQADVRWLTTDSDVPAEVVILYATAWDGNSGVMARFRDAANAVLNGQGQADGLNHREAMLFNEEVASRYRQHASGELIRLKQVAAGAFAVLFCGLALLYVLVLRPAISLVRIQIRRQAVLGDAIIASGHGVLLLEDKGQISFANGYAEDLTGFGVGGLVGMDLGRLLFSAYGEDTAEVILDAAASKSWRGDVRLVRQDGIVTWVEMVVSAAVPEGGFLVIFFDATQRREAEAKLRQARERLAAAIETVDDGFALYDAEERLVLFNRKFASFAPQLEPWVVPGAKIEDMLQHAWKLGLVDTELGLDRFVALRLAQFRSGYGQSEVRLTDGRILRASERRTPEGGWVQVIADVTAANANRDQLRRALEQAEAASRSKTVFLSSMSHELRTPLNSILGFAQLLDGNADGVFGPSQHRAVKHILRAGQGLNDLIGQVLMLAELEAGKIHLQTGLFDLAGVVNAVIERQRERLERMELKLECRGCDMAMAVRGDGERMADVVGHLLSNAIKFNQPGGSVEVVIRPALGGMVRLAITDSGAGIAADARDKVFQAFNRLGAEGSSIEGAGIGLTIARALVEQMGGCIGFDSVPGRGSTFWVDVLAAQDSDAPAGCRGAVLALSASAQNRQILEAVAMGYPQVSLQVAENCAEAEGLLASGAEPDLILVDLRYAGGDTVALCQTLRSQPSTRFLPLVAITDESSPAEATRLAALGFDGLLGQPIEPAELMSVIRRYCQEASFTVV